MPGDSGVLVVTRVRSTTTKCTRGRGRIGRPAFPAPSDRRVRKFLANLGRNEPRDREAAFAVVCDFESACVVPVFRRDDLPPATPADQLSSPSATQNLDLNCSNFQ